MALAQYLIDKSALTRLASQAVTQALTPLVRAGLTATAGIVALEMLYSARRVAEHDRIRADLRAHEWLHAIDEDFSRAIDVQRELCTTGRHRAVSLPDLLVAAIAERHNVTVLHYDADFDLIADVTGQPTRWVVPRGSVA
ncbi:PIN domain nuclease [Kribbella sp. NBC_01245]|uniref:PIN domain nuclease n=1 Tax=Kribbella sp. NBC_01245 TaxID=2903578 RepID=UPI002E2B6BB9|nr:PIN domain nuclease [Kribbella sp. NBC_01245]